MKKKRYFCDLDEKLAKVDPRKIYGGFLALALCFSLIAYVVYTFAFSVPKYPEEKYVYLEDTAKNVVTAGGIVDISKITEDVELDIINCTPGESQWVNLSLSTNSEIGPANLGVAVKYDENLDVVSCKRNYNEKQFESKVKRDMLWRSFGYGVIIVFFIVILEIWLASLSRKHKEHDLEKLKQQHNDSKEK